MKYLLPLLLIFGCSHLTAVRESEKNFQVLWNHNNDPEYKTGNLPVALNAPAIFQGVVFLGNNGGGMQAFDLRNGRKIWHASDEKEYGQFHDRPIFYQEMVLYGTARGRFFARDYLTGDLKYALDLGDSPEAPGEIFEGRILLHLRNHKIVCMDVMTGKMLWSYQRSVPYVTTLQKASRPIVINRKVIVGMADGFVIALNLDDGVLSWEQKVSFGNKFVDVDASPVLIGDKIMVGPLNGQLALLDSKTGSLIKRFDFAATRSPVMVDKNFILGTADGHIIKLDQFFNVIQDVKIASGGITSLKIWKSKLVVGTITPEMFLVNVENLAVVDKFNFGHSHSSVLGDMDVERDYLAVLSSRNRLYIFK
jgi:outer membrane protein assembly factor BamB